MADLSEVLLDMVTKADVVRFASMRDDRFRVTPGREASPFAMPGTVKDDLWPQHLRCPARRATLGRGSEFGGLHLVTNSSPFLVLPGGGPNLGSRVLSLPARRLVRDWPYRFGSEVLLMETLFDPSHLPGHGLSRSQPAQDRAHSRFGRLGSDPWPVRACLSLLCAGCAPSAENGPP